MLMLLRCVAVVFLLAAGAFAANVRLYLTDGEYHVVREYHVVGDRVRFYSVERSAWEEAPLSLVDLKRTKAAETAEAEQRKQRTAEISAEEQFERQQREEIERVPQGAGVYLVRGSEIDTFKPAESKVVTNKGRSILKILAPIPVVAGKATLELDGKQSERIVPSDRPEFYVRINVEERFGIVKLEEKKDSRVVQKWSIVPVSNEIFEEQQDIEVFRRELEDGLYKIWPVKPLAPGEYAVIQYTQGKGNVQVWDFSYRRNIPPGTPK